MKENYSNRGHEIKTKEDFFNKVSIPFNETKEEIWDKLSEHITEPKIETRQTIFMPWMRYAAAAVVLLLFGAALFMKFYTVTFSSSNKQFADQILPDGSTVSLNASSSVSFHPYLWWLDRSVEFEGEGFFEVKKGSKFTVHSEQGTTEVLGTSFNIYSRGLRYEVFCKTGKVMVTSPLSEVKFIIKPGELASIDNTDNTGYISNREEQAALAWMNNMLNFSSEYLTDVFSELERQYDVSIEFLVSAPEEYIYSGFFDKMETVDSTLNLICLSFDLTFAEESKGKFKVLQRED